MNQILQATYHDGRLVLDKKLDATLEGKKFTLILIEESVSSGQTSSDLERQNQSFLDWIKQYSAQLVPGYKFDREEIHER
jgi:hypothetical protein